MTVMLLAVIAIAAAACEFGEHRGSHSNAYQDDDRNYPERDYQRPYQPENSPDY
jgi:hypothetical protein